MFRWIRRAYRSWRNWRLRVHVRRGGRLAVDSMRKDLARRGIAFPFDRMYWIGCMEYKNIADQDVILDAVHRVDLAFLRNLPPPSPTADHLIVELLTGSDNTAMLVGQISPYELWDPDVIFALQRCTIDQCAGYLDQEQGKDMPPLPDDDPE